MPPEKRFFYSPPSPDGWCLPAAGGRVGGGGVPQLSGGVCRGGVAAVCDSVATVYLGDVDVP